MLCIYTNRRKGQQFISWRVSSLCALVTSYHFWIALMFYRIYSSICRGFKTKFLAKSRGLTYSWEILLMGLNHYMLWANHTVYSYIFAASKVNPHSVIILHWKRQINLIISSTVVLFAPPCPLGLFTSTKAE